MVTLSENIIYTYMLYENMTERSFNQLHLRKNVEGFLVVAEVSLFNSSGDNISLLGTAIASSEDFGGLAANAIDGSTGTSDVSGTIHHSATGPAETWTLILDRNYLQGELSEVTILARSAGTNHDDITVELVSDDGLGPLELGTTIVTATQTFSVPDVVYTTEPTYSQVTITTINNQELNFAEFQLFNTSGENIALLGTASQTSTSFGTQGQASNGNDGNTDAVLVIGSSGAIVHTSYGGVWTLTLDRSYEQSELSNAVVYNRDATNESLRFIGAPITLISDDSRDDLLIGTGIADLIQTFVITIDTTPVIPSGFVQDGAILHFDANDTSSYTEGAEILTDTLGSTTTLITRSGIPTFLNGGGLDFSATNNSLTTSDLVTFRTISLWTEKPDTVFGNPLFLTNSPADGFIISNTQPAAASTAGTFFPTASVYIDGVLSDYDGYNNIPNNELHHVAFVGSADITGNLHINGSGNTTAYDTSVIFHSVVLYDKALSESEILENYNAGSGSYQPFSAIPRPTSIDVSVTSIEHVTGYRLISQETGSTNVRVVNTNFTDLNQVVSGLALETEYTLSLFYTYADGPGYQLLGSSVVSTVPNSSEHYDTANFGSDGNFDLSSLSDGDFSLVSEVLNDLFTTGDIIEIKVAGVPSSKKSKFVNTGSNVDITDSEALVAPFNTGDGPGQTFDMTLSDTSTVTVAYDESDNSIVIDGVSYSAGDSLILDGKKVVIFDL